MKSLLSLFLPALILLSGCQPKSSTNDAAMDADVQAAAYSADLPDTTGASVWAYLRESNYQEEWALWPDKGELYEGQKPHGMLLTTYLNETALEALNSDAAMMPESAIIVKENYMPDSTLAAVTVMYKVDGFNPEHNDWFFSKHKPDGTLDTGPNDMPLEGRVMGCQNCHGAQRPNDYIFTERLAE